jgi:hypothetical protein
MDWMTQGAGQWLQMCWDIVKPNPSYHLHLAKSGLRAEKTKEILTNGKDVRREGVEPTRPRATLKRAVNTVSDCRLRHGVTRWMRGCCGPS